MEDAVLKSRTDCVYFLASPLTCKKGAECEFRHSENARINPRDCRYWMNGNCINPNCAFRHPPLEGLTESAPNHPGHHFSQYSAVSTSKLGVPCYFYFNSYCIKGDQCSFLHDIPVQKSSKEVAEPASIHPPPELKSSTRPPSAEGLTNPSEELMKQPEARGTVFIEESISPSAESSLPECEEEMSTKLPPAPSGGHLCTEESSEEHIVPDEFWESSPGFDVLVNDEGSDHHLAYQDDAEHLILAQEESEMLHKHLLQYGTEGLDGYDCHHPIIDRFPDAAGYLYEPSHGFGFYDDHLEDGYAPCDYDERSREEERSSKPIMCRKRKASDCVDLRDHLRKQRRMDVRQVTYNSRKHRPSRSRGGPLSLRTRLGSEVDNHRIVSLYSEAEPVPRGRRMQGWSEGYLRLSSRRDQTRHKEKERRRRSPQSSENADSARVRFAGFTGPKSLAQIREEKGRAKAGHQHRRLSKRPVSNEFESPKPLNELLKEKRIGSVVCSQAENQANNSHGTDERRDGEYDSSFIDDDDVYDEDHFGRTLARILSR